MNLSLYHYYLSDVGDVGDIGDTQHLREEKNIWKDFSSRYWNLKQNLHLQNSTYINFKFTKNFAKKCLDASS